MSSPKIHTCSFTSGMTQPPARLAPLRSPRCLLIFPTLRLSDHLRCLRQRLPVLGPRLLLPSRQSTLRLSDRLQHPHLPSRQHC